MQFLLALLIALMATMVLIPPLIRFAGALQALDLPNERKVHDVAVPRVGGIAMVVAVLLAAAILIPFDVQSGALLAGIVLLLGFGIWDDRRELGYRIKFLGQFAAVTVVVYFGGAVLAQLPFAGLEPKSLLITVPLTIFCIVGITNAFNLSDGLDGLAAGAALLSLSAIALLAYLADGSQVLILALAIIGCVLGFLRFNTHPAKVFMGDTGSQFLGFSIGVLAVLLTQRVNPALSPMLPLLLIGLPLLDTASVIGQRLIAGRSPFSPDRNHIHHKLLELGFDHYEAVVIIYLAQALFVVSGLVFRYESDLFLVLLYLGICTLFVASLWLARRTGWKARTKLQHSPMGKFVGAMDESSWGEKLAFLVLNSLVPALLLVSALFVSAIPMDLAIASGLVFIALLLRLLFGYRLWFLHLRFLVFVTMAFVVYLTGIHAPGMELFPRWYEHIFYGILVLALLVAIRYSRKDVFRITPTDYLMILMVLGMAALPEQRLEQYYLVQSAIKMAILFYCTEMVLQRMRNRWNVFTVTALVTLAVVAARGAVA